MHKNGQASALPSCLGESTPGCQFLTMVYRKECQREGSIAAMQTATVEEDERGVNVMAAKKGCRTRLQSAHA